MTTELVNALASRFVARTDVKAVQTSNGGYMPVRNTDEEYLPFTRKDFEDHLAGSRTYGHYLLNTDDECKLFAFDIDLEKAGYLPNEYIPETGYTADPNGGFHSVSDLRGEWHNRANPARKFIKTQLHSLANVLAIQTHKILEIDVAVTYTGNKGLHVYGFTGRLPATEARTAGIIVLESLGCFETVRGENFYKHIQSGSDTDWLDSYPNLSIELFPKQGSLAGKDLGNLMRLPLGRNVKTSDPTFFVDMTAPLTELVPTDPLRALAVGNNPWQS